MIYDPFGCRFSFYSYQIVFACLEIVQMLFTYTDAMSRVSTFPFPL